MDIARLTKLHKYTSIRTYKGLSVIPSNSAAKQF